MKKIGICQLFPKTPRGRFMRQITVFLRFISFAVESHAVRPQREVGALPLFTDKVKGLRFREMI